MNRRDNREPLPSPASRESVQAFNAQKLPFLGPQAHTLRLDISSVVKSPWNIQAAKVFCADLRLCTDKGMYPDLPDVSDSEIEKSFMTHLIHLRRQYMQSVRL